MAPQRRIDVVLDSVRRLLRIGATANLFNLLQKQHPADLAAVFGELPERDRKAAFTIVVERSPKLAMEAVSELGPEAAALWPEGGNLARRLNVEESGRIERLGAQASGAAGPWRLTGIDPEGLDLRAGERTARLEFPSAVDSVTRALDFIRKV